MTNKQKQLILAWFDCLNPKAVDGIWGPQSERATRKLQNKLGIEADGNFGKITANEALNAMIGGRESEAGTTASDWWKEIEYFSPKEFACKCGRYCDGYPYDIQPQMVKIADRARKYFGQPITIVSGLRCQQHNDNVGGVPNSQHMYGEAADIHLWNVDSDKVLAWFQNQIDVRYAYRIENSDNIHFDIVKGAR